MRRRFVLSFLSAGPVRSGCVGRLGHFTVSGWDGGRGPTGAAGEGGAWSRAAPPVDLGTRSVGVLPDAGSRRWVPPSGSGRTQPVRGGVAPATDSPWKLPEAQLQARQRHPVGGSTSVVENPKSTKQLDFIQEEQLNLGNVRKLKVKQSFISDAHFTHVSVKFLIQSFVQLQNWAAPSWTLREQEVTLPWASAASCSSTC